MLTKSLLDKIKFKPLHERVTTVEGAAAVIREGMSVAMSGYAMAGYPKAVVEALVHRKHCGEALSIHLITGANVPYLDEKLGAEKIISRRTPMCASPTLATQINHGSVHYVEQQMNKMPRLLRSGRLGKIDVAVVEALGINETGELIPTTSSGLNWQFIQAAAVLIIEINTTQPEMLGSLHDIHLPQLPPFSQPIPLVRTNQRIGNPFIPIDLNKDIYIIESAIPERANPKTIDTPESDRLTKHLFAFLKDEYQTALGGKLPPIQLGFGSLANSVANAFLQTNMGDLQFFCGGIGEPIMELIAAKKAVAISTGGLEMSDRVEQIINQTQNLRDILVIRNGDIINNAEIIGRMGLLALNTGIEVDLYGNVNASHINGNRVVNGIGGGANFAQNAELSIILIPSTSKAGAISTIVPMVFHHDIGEHDVDVLVTEHGVADLRGLDDSERADAILAQCTVGPYQQQLANYLELARQTVGGHHPQLPEEAILWYRRFKESGTMLEDQR
ncbi:MAG: acetyl-CoA hydrolase/transferase C-terminal domain-containing protein [Eubacteriales bacterium]|nr:acetyl-CoA hydrolase/transferase C-terminal domain-containing protein [Eubacteriales bacterium]